MGRDKTKDGEYIDCDQVAQLTYVAGLYGDKKDEVLRFLLNKCEIGKTNSVTHSALYKYIEESLGLKVPD